MRPGPRRSRAAVVPVRLAGRCRCDRCSSAGGDIQLLSRSLRGARGTRPRLRTEAVGARAGTRPFAVPLATRRGAERLPRWRHAARRTDAELGGRSERDGDLRAGEASAPPVVDAARDFPAASGWRTSVQPFACRGMSRESLPSRSRGDGTPTFGAGRPCTDSGGTSGESRWTGGPHDALPHVAANRWPYGVPRWDNEIASARHCADRQRHRYTRTTFACARSLRPLWISRHAYCREDHTGGRPERGLNDVRSAKTVGWLARQQLPGVSPERPLRDQRITVCRVLVSQVASRCRWVRVCVTHES